MIELNETYQCEEFHCGRKFDKKEELIEHCKRRHPDFYKKASSENNTNTSFYKNNMNKTQNLLRDLEDKISQIEQHNRTASQILNYDIQDDESLYINVEGVKNDIFINESEKMKSTMSSTFYKNHVFMITDEMIGIGTKYSDYDEIEELDLEEKQLGNFKTKRDVNFTYLLYVQSVNLSKNYIKDLSDIKHLNTIKILNISHNKIDDISALESLENLEIFKAENNEITTITVLAKCRFLRICEMSDNKIRYTTSSLKTFQSMSQLKELTIKNNPVI